KEILSIDEMVAEFELTDLHKSGAVFDIEKLRWYNREYLLHLPGDEFSRRAITVFHEAIAARGIEWNDVIAHKIVPTVMKERIHTWYDIRTLVNEGEFDYFFQDPAPNPDNIPQKGSAAAVASDHMKKVVELFSPLSEDDFAHAERI